MAPPPWYNPPPPPHTRPSHLPSLYCQPHGRGGQCIINKTNRPVFLFSLLFFHCHMSLFLSVLGIQNVHFIAMCLSVPGLRRMECSRVPTQILFSNSYGFAVLSMSDRKFSLRQLISVICNYSIYKEDLTEISNFKETMKIYNLSIQCSLCFGKISKIPCVFIYRDSFWPFSLFSFLSVFS